jgi:uncharacterized protein
MAAATPERFYPGRVAIEAYGAAGFRFAGMQHEGALLILPDGFHRWNVRALDSLTPEDFAPVLQEAKPGSFLLLGTGATIARPPKPVREAFAQANIGLDYMDTGAAVRTWNVLVAEDRDAFCALLVP